jgi:chromosome segregation ATPase
MSAQQRLSTAGKEHEAGYTALQLENASNGELISDLQTRLDAAKETLATAEANLGIANSRQAATQLQLDTTKKTLATAETNLRSANSRQTATQIRARACLDEEVSNCHTTSLVFSTMLARERRRSVIARKALRNSAVNRFANLENTMSQLTSDKIELANVMHTVRSDLGTTQSAYTTLENSHQQQLDRVANHITNTKARAALTGKSRLLFMMWKMKTKAIIAARTASTVDQ